MTIYRQAGMPIMAKIIEGLFDRVGPYIYIELKNYNTNEDHLKKSLENHQKMLESLREGDAKKLNRWLTLDHNLTTSRIVRIIEERENELKNV
jgi:DNA-binding GntR family transcriptional regulator